MPCVNYAICTGIFLENEGKHDVSKTSPAHSGNAAQ